MNIKLGPPPLVSDSQWVDRVKRCGSKLLGHENVIELAHPSMGAEDFAFVMEKAPGVSLDLVREAKAVLMAGSTAPTLL